MFRLAPICVLAILLGCDAPPTADHRAEQRMRPAPAAKETDQQEQERIPAAQLIEDAQAIVVASTPERFREFDEQLGKVQAAEKAGQYLDDEARKPFQQAARAAAAQNELWRCLSLMWARLGEFDKAMRAAQQIRRLSPEPMVAASAPLLLAPGRYQDGYESFWRDEDLQVPRATALSYIAEQQIELGKLAEARETLGLIDTPDEKANAQRLLGLGRLLDAYLQRDQLAEARELAQLFPTWQSKYPQLAVWYAQRGRTDDVRQLASDHAQDPDVASSLVRLLATAGHPGLAMELYRKLLAGKLDENGLFACAEAFIAQRKLNEAREVIELIRSPARPEAEKGFHPRMLDLLLSFAKAQAAVDKERAAAEFQRAIEYCAMDTRADEGSLHRIAHVVAALAAADNLEQAVQTSKRAQHGTQIPRTITGQPRPRPDAAQEALRIGVNVLVGQANYAAALKLAGQMPVTGARASGLRFVAERAEGDIKTAALEELTAYILAYRIDWDSPATVEAVPVAQGATREEAARQARGLKLYSHTVGMRELLEPFKGQEAFGRLAARADEAEEVTRRLILTAYVADLLARKNSQEAVQVADRLLLSLKDPEELGRGFDGIAEAFADHGHLDHARRYGQRKLEETGNEVAGGAFWRAKIRAFSEQMRRLETLEKPASAMELASFLEAWMHLAKDTPLTIEQCDLAARQARQLGCLDRAAIPLAQAYAIHDRLETAREMLRGAGDERRYQYGLEGVTGYLISSGHLRQAIVLLPEIEDATARHVLERRLVDAMIPAQATAAVVSFARQQAPADRARLLLLIADRLVSDSTKD